MGPAPAPRLEYRLGPVQVSLLLGLQASHRHLSSQGRATLGPEPAPSRQRLFQDPLVSAHWFLIMSTQHRHQGLALCRPPLTPPKAVSASHANGSAQQGWTLGTAVAAGPGLGDRKQRQPPSGQPQAGREIQPSHTETEGQLTGSSQAASPQASVQPKRGRRARGVGRATRISSPRHRSAEALRAVSLMAEQLPARSPLAWGQHPSSGTRASPTGRR